MRARVNALARLRAIEEERETERRQHAVTRARVQTHDCSALTKDAGDK